MGEQHGLQHCWVLELGKQLPRVKTGCIRVRDRVHMKPPHRTSFLGSVWRLRKLIKSVADQVLGGQVHGGKGKE